MTYRSALDTALYTALNVPAVTALAPSGVFNTTVPPGTLPVYLVFSWEAETVEALFDRRQFEAVYSVKAIVESQWPKQGSAIDAVIDGLLDNQPLSVAGFRHLETRRQDGISVPPRPEDGPLWFQVGARYRVRLDALED